VDFSKITTFNLDEYVGIPPDHEQSYNRFMWDNLFSHINAHPRFVHIPNGMASDINAHCEWYEQEIQNYGGLDLQVLGIGANGHIAFNEPGSSLGSRTRVKTLTKTTREDNARFFGSLENVPRNALTMGVGTVMEARELLLIASGDSKAEAIREAIEGPLTAMVPASIIQMHRKATVIVDQAAASRLTGEYAETLEEAMLIHPPTSGAERAAQGEQANT
jgi:glucosamine-6-phosphate deaminase